MLASLDWLDTLEKSPARIYFGYDGSSRRPDLPRVGSSHEIAARFLFDLGDTILVAFGLQWQRTISAFADQLAPMEQP